MSGKQHDSLRSPLWPARRRMHLLREPACAYCGALEFVQVHHIQPFHLYPALELDESNLIALCEPPGPMGCHLRHGHLMNWHNWNLNIRAECAEQRRGMDLDEIRAQLRRVLLIASTVTAMTPTPKDDIAVATLAHIVNDDVVFNGVKELLAKNPPPVAA